MDLNQIVMNIFLNERDNFSASFNMFSFIDATSKIKAFGFIMYIFLIASIVLDIGAQIKIISQSLVKFILDRMTRQH